MDAQRAGQDTVKLIRMGKAGDRHALNILFARYHNRVLRIVRLRLNSGMRDKLRTQSMDILQEVFMKAFENLPGFEPAGEGAFIHWLSRIVENVVRDKLDFAAAKKRASEGELSLDETLAVSGDMLHLGDMIPAQVTSPTRHLLKRDIQTLVDGLLLELDERDREVIISHKLEELTFTEIASYSGESADAVRKRFKRSYMKLVSIAEDRKILQELRLWRPCLRPPNERR